jgi:hypothetical protein
MLRTHVTTLVRLVMTLARLACLGALTLLLAAPADAAMRGHLSLGYGKLFITDSKNEDDEAPGGSLSVAAGLDFPLAGDFRIGGEVGFHLLGGRTLTEGSLVANIDYSVAELSALVHWEPHGLGPVARISAGPTLTSARADLSSSGGGITFSDFAVEEIAGGFATSVTLMQQKAAPVRAGVEIGARTSYLPDATWIVATARLAIHY